MEIKIGKSMHTHRRIVSVKKQILICLEVGDRIEIPTKLINSFRNNIKNIAKYNNMKFATKKQGNEYYIIWRVF